MSVPSSSGDAEFDPTLYSSQTGQCASPQDTTAFARIGKPNQVSIQRRRVLTRNGEHRSAMNRYQEQRIAGVQRGNRGGQSSRTSILSQLHQSLSAKPELHSDILGHAIRQVAQGLDAHRFKPFTFRRRAKLCIFDLHRKRPTSMVWCLRRLRRRRERALEIDAWKVADLRSRAALESGKPCRPHAQSSRRAIWEKRRAFANRHTSSLAKSKLPSNSSFPLDANESDSVRRFRSPKAPHLRHRQLRLTAGRQTPNLRASDDLGFVQ